MPWIIGARSPSMKCWILFLMSLTGVINGDCGVCNCTDCVNSNTLYVGTHEELYSPKCAEGSVATVTKLNTNSKSGPYEILTWNRGAYSDNLPGRKPYIYGQASIPQNTYCFKAPASALPVIGDQREIKVTLNCEHLIKCDLEWTVNFGCVDTAVTTTGVQVLSDVDDTILCPDPQCSTVSDCSISERKAFYSGVDKRLDHKEAYPGAAELYLGLALGPSSTTATVPAKPMLLSARPKEFEAALAIGQDDHINTYFETAGSRQTFHNWGINLDSSMYGTIFDGTNHKEFGETKAKHFNRISDELPNTRFVFFGDNGQGDVCGAQSMFNSENGKRLLATFIHLSQTDPSKILQKCEDPLTGNFDLNLPESDKVHYFSTHSNATLWALQHDMISCCSATNVHKAVQEWHKCRCDGQCPTNHTLPTGVATKATRTETIMYCKDVQQSQEQLATGIAAKCPNFNVDACQFNADASIVPDAINPCPKSAAVATISSIFQRVYSAIAAISIFLLLS